jgi:uncharacterized glyoxalase superfamily protein PhnB
MLTNRSVPVDTVLPHVTYKHLPEAMAWLGRTFGLVEHYRYGNPISGAQVRLGKAYIMVRAARGNYRSPAELGFGNQSLTIFLEDVERHFEHSKAPGQTSSRISTKLNTGSCNTEWKISKVIIGCFPATPAM